MNQHRSHRAATLEPCRNRHVDAGRAGRLNALADRLERTLAHQLVELAPLAWDGTEAASAIAAMRACCLELAVAASGLRTTAERVGDRA